jgi:Na+-driven multidrug efflux pump
VLAWLFRREVLAAAGATGEVPEIGAGFLTITLPSMPLIALGVTASALLRAAVDAWRSMAMTMVAVVLAPIRIVWLQWE